MTSLIYLKCYKLLSDDACTSLNPDSHRCYSVCCICLFLLDEEDDNEDSGLMEVGSSDADDDQTGDADSDGDEEEEDDFGGSALHQAAGTASSNDQGEYGLHCSHPERSLVASKSCYHRMKSAAFEALHMSVCSSPHASSSLHMYD